MSLDEPSYELIQTGRVPIKAWTRGLGIEGSAAKQLTNISQLPIVFRHVAVMPDVHFGIGATVGSVVPTEGAIIPAAVGVDIAGTGNVLLLEVERAQGRELVAGFGEQGTRAELVASRACAELAAFLAADVPVGEHLADQLLLPLAIASGGAFRCTPLSRHATTNIDTIGRFIEVPIRVEPAGDAVIVRVG